MADEATTKDPDLIAPCSVTTTGDEEWIVLITCGLLPMRSGEVNTMRR